MVVSVEHNSEFILIHTAAGYGRAARISGLPRIAGNFLGVAAGSSIVRRTAGRSAYGAGTQNKLIICLK